MKRKSFGTKKKEKNPAGQAHLPLLSFPPHIHASRNPRAGPARKNSAVARHRPLALADWWTRETRMSAPSPTSPVFLAPAPDELAHDSHSARPATASTSASSLKAPAPPPFPLAPHSNRAARPPNFSIASTADRRTPARNTTTPVSPCPSRFPLSPSLARAHLLDNS